MAFTAGGIQGGVVIRPRGGGNGGGSTIDGVARALAQVDTMEAGETVPDGYTVWALGKHWTAPEGGGDLTAPATLTVANIQAAGFEEETGAASAPPVYADNLAAFPAVTSPTERVYHKGNHLWYVKNEARTAWAPESLESYFDTLPLNPAAAAAAEIQVGQKAYEASTNSSYKYSLELGDLVPTISESAPSAIPPASAITTTGTRANYTPTAQTSQGEFEGIDAALANVASPIDRYTSASNIASNSRSLGITDASSFAFNLPPTPSDGDYSYVYRKGANELIVKPAAAHTVDLNSAGVSLTTDGTGALFRFHAATNDWESMGALVVAAPEPTALLHLTGANSATIQLIGDTAATIDWGDGTEEPADGTVQTHNYASAYTGDVTIVHQNTATELVVTGPFDNPIGELSELPLVRYQAGGGAINSGPISALTTVTETLVLTGATLPIALGDIQSGVATKRLEVSGSAAITGSPGDLPAGAITEDLLLTGGGCAVGGNTADIVAGFATNRFRLAGGTFTGAASALPAGFATIVFWLQGGTGLTGTWADLQADIGQILLTLTGVGCAITGPANTINANLGKTTFDIGDNCSISGDVGDFPIAIGRSTFRVRSSTVAGDLAGIPSDIGEQSLFFLETSGTLTCSAVRAGWDPIIVEIYGNMSAASVDNLIIGLAGQSTRANGQLRIAGSNAAPTAASAAASATLTGNGWTVVTN